MWPPAQEVPGGQAAVAVSGEEGVHVDQEGGQEGWGPRGRLAESGHPITGPLLTSLYLYFKILLGCCYFMYIRQ